VEHAGKITAQESKAMFTTFSRPSKDWTESKPSARSLSWRVSGDGNSLIFHSERKSPEMQQPEFNWKTYVSNLTLAQCRTIAAERGVKELTIEGLRTRNYIASVYIASGGGHCIAFPIQDENGNVFRAHCRALVRNGDGKMKWLYEPAHDPLKRPIPALIYGQLSTARIIHIFESQWDKIALIDRLELLPDIDAGEVCTISTRSAEFGNRLKTLKWPAGATIYAWPQKDPMGQKWTGKTIVDVGGCCVVEIPPGLNGVKDLNEWTRDGKATADNLKTAFTGAEFRSAPEEQKQKTEQAETEKEQPRIMIECLKPSQVIAYEPPPGVVLAGDNHIVRDAVFIIGGPPGIGKSRLLVWLARCGAFPVPWMGYDVHVKFRTLIIQNENGRYRLKLELSALNCPELEDSLLITPPPPFGLCFDRQEFRDQLKGYADTFQPHLVGVDPWNAAARDDRQKEYQETFDDIRDVFPPGVDGPALGIIAHTRKPYPNERASGRALLNLLAGSYVLGSIPRSVWILQAASDDVTDERVVLTCCKNNDGELGPRSAWARRNGLFVPSDIDWEAFDHPDAKSNKYNGTIEDLFAIIPVVKPITRDELYAKATGKISRDNIREFIAELLRGARIFIHKVPNPVAGFRGLVGYAKTAPQDVDIDVDIDDDTDVEDDPR
jgi:hypothetical protein